MIKIAKELSLPLDAVTQKLAWLGRTGSGKTFACKRMVEQMLHARAQVIVLDPVGVWAGLRRGPKAFDIPILGGLYGDVPLEPTAGAVVAEFVASKRASVVLDVSQMLDAERTRFATAWAGTFFAAQRKAPSAVHVVLDECQEFVPQNPQDGEQLMLHQFQRFAKQGRGFGIGLSLLSQRPQEISKKVLNQTECVFAFQLTGPHERKALEYWLSDKGLEEKLSTLLPRLEVGCPHVWSPSWLKVSKVVRILPIDTLDTSQTPKVGAKAARAEKLRPIELDALRSSMAETIELQKANDPKELRKRIAELERAAKNVPAPERVEVVTFDRAGFNLLQNRVLDAMTAAAAEAQRLLDKAAGLAAQHMRDYAEEMVGPDAPRAPPKAVIGIPGPPLPHYPAPGPVQPVTFARPPTNGLSKCARGLLVALCQHGRLNLTQAAITAGYAPSAGTVFNAAGELRRLGYAEGENAALDATPNGRKLCGEDRLPQGRDLADYWLRKLSRCEGMILARVLEHPHGLSLHEAATKAGYAPTAGTVFNAAGKLRTLGLIEGKNAFMTPNPRLL